MDSEMQRGTAAGIKTQCIKMQSYLAIFLCVGACEQRVEDDDCLVQIPHKHPLENKKRRGENEGCSFREGLALLIVVLRTACLPSAAL